MKKVLFLLILVFAGCKEEILHNLTEEEANRLITQLHQTQIDADKVKQPDGAWAIAVPNAKSGAALQYLSDARVYRRESIAQKKKGSLLRGRDEQRFFFERALSMEIESTLTALRGALEARVHLNLPVKDPLLGRKLSKHDNGSGSVLIVVGEDFHEKEEHVAALVAGASGIPIDQISVLMSHTELASKVKDVPQAVRVGDELERIKQQPDQQASLLSTASLPTIGAGVFILGAMLLGFCLFFPSKKKLQSSQIFGGLS